MEAQTAKIAEELLKIKAVRFEPQKPFTWASGWKSPVYCDNRLSLSYPGLRSAISEALVSKIEENFPGVSGIAGVATAGIPQGALVADRMSLPFLYIRSEAKKHGMGNQIEGRLEPDHAYVVVEDLISTGGSSLAAVEALQAAGGKVLGVACIFDYGFPHARLAFEKAGLRCFSLLGLDALLAKAVEIAYIQPAELEVISNWRTDPEGWTRNFLQGVGP